MWLEVRNVCIDSVVEFSCCIVVLGCVWVSTELSVSQAAASPGHSAVPRGSPELLREQLSSSPFACLQNLQCVLQNFLNYLPVMFSLLSRGMGLLCMLDKCQTNYRDVLDRMGSLLLGLGFFI